MAFLASSHFKARSLWARLDGRQRWILGGIILALLASASVTLAFGFILKTLVDQGFLNGDSTHLNNTLIMMLGLVIIMGLASFTRMTLSGLLGEELVSALRVEAFKHLLTLDPSFYQRENSGEIAARLTSDMTLIQTVVSSSLPMLVRNALMIMGGFTMLVLTSGHLSLLVLALLPLVAIPVIVIGRMVRRTTKTAQDEVSALGGFLAESLQTIQTLQSFTAEALYGQRFADRSRAAVRAGMRQTAMRAGMAASIIVVLFSSITVVLWLGAHEVLDGTMSAGQLTSFVFYAALVASAFGVLGDVSASLFRAAAGFERVRAIMGIQSSLPDIAKAVGPWPLRGSIAFETVHFAYPERIEAIDAPLDPHTRPHIHGLAGCSFEVEAGETIAIVGPSGAGKTTIFQLLMRFYDPVHGSITLDGHDLRTLRLHDVRSHIAHVPQDPALLSDTVTENIRLGKPDATLAEIEQAAMAAQAHDFILSLPQGYDTQLGERGMRLSGGQRQRLALARAFLKDAPVLLLDEATSALDTDNERAIQSALHFQRGKRTILVIAHRLSTIMDADRILVIDGGRVREHGTHAELMAKGGLYKRMVEQQFSMEEREARAKNPNLPLSFH